MESLDAEFSEAGRTPVPDGPGIPVPEFYGSQEAKDRHVQKIGKLIAVTGKQITKYVNLIESLGVDIEEYRAALAQAEAAPVKPEGDAK